MENPKEKGRYLIKDILKQVQEQYQLPEIVDHGFFTSGGYENINAWFTTKNDEKYVVRLALYDDPKGTEDWLSAELQVLDLLNRESLNGYKIPVPELLTTKSGSKYFEFDCPEEMELEDTEYSYVVVSKFVNGEHLMEWDGRREMWQTERIGFLMGQLHLKVLNWKPKNDVRMVVTAKRCLNLFHLAIESYKQNVSLEQGEKLEKIFETLAKLFPEHLDADKEQEDLPRGFVHGDLHDINVLFDTNKKEVACVLDWDDACFMPLVYDVALSVLEWCCLKWRLQEDYLGAFLHNYQLSRKLTSKENKLLWNYVVLSLCFPLAFLMQPENRDEEALLCIEQYIHTYENDVLPRIVYPVQISS